MSIAAIEYLSEKFYRRDMKCGVRFPKGHHQFIKDTLESSVNKNKIKVINRNGVNIFITKDNRKKWVDSQYE